MATHITTPNSLVGFLGDQIGVQSGLALTRSELEERTTSEVVRQYLRNESDDLIRVKSSDILDAYQEILHKLGVIPEPFAGHGPTIMRMKYAGDHAKALLVKEVIVAIGKYHFDRGKSYLSQGFDAAGYFSIVQESLPEPALALAKELVELILLSERANPWVWRSDQDLPWRDVVALSGLFKNESLDTQHGSFFDRRFITYLLANTEEIGTIHWRKFEGLVGEYLQSQGMQVDMGPGRNDGGVDIRAWSSGKDRSTPPTLLVQCKRQKAVVEKVVIKALWADVIDEKAESGLLVTTSRLAPGAKVVRDSRAYPITSIDRAGLRKWLEALHVPGTGVYLGE